MKTALLLAVLTLPLAAQAQALASCHYTVLSTPAPRTSGRFVIFSVAFRNAAADATPFAIEDVSYDPFAATPNQEALDRVRQKCIELRTEAIWQAAVNVVMQTTANGGLVGKTGTVTP